MYTYIIFNLTWFHFSQLYFLSIQFFKFQKCSIKTSVNSTVSPIPGTVFLKLKFFFFNKWSITRESKQVIETPVDLKLFDKSKSKPKHWKVLSPIFSSKQKHSPAKIVHILWRNFQWNFYKSCLCLSLYLWMKLPA